MRALPLALAVLLVAAPALHAQASGLVATFATGTVTVQKILLGHAVCSDVGIANVTLGPGGSTSWPANEAGAAIVSVSSVCSQQNPPCFALCSQVTQTYRAIHRPDDWWQLRGAGVASQPGQPPSLSPNSDSGVVMHTAGGWSISVSMGGREDQTFFQVGGPIFATELP